MTKRVTRKKTATPAPGRPDPATRPKAVIDAVAREVGAAKPATEARKPQPGKTAPSPPPRSPAKPAPAKDRETRSKPDAPRPSPGASRSSPAAPGKPPRAPIGQLISAGAIGAVLVIAVTLVLRFASQSTGSLVAEISGAGPVDRQLAVALGDIEALRTELSRLRGRADARDTSVRSALAAQAERIAGLDASVRAAQAAFQKSLQSLTQNFAVAQRKTGPIAAGVSALKGEIDRVKQTVDRLAALPRPAAGIGETAAPAGALETARLTALEGSVASINGAVAGITADLAQLRAGVKTLAAPAGADRRALAAQMANQVTKVSQRIENLEKNLDQLAAKTDLAGLWVYYRTVADRMKRGLAFERSLKLLVGVLGAPSPALAAHAATGVWTRGQLAQALKAVMQSAPPAPTSGLRQTGRPPEATGWLARLAARASRAITISKTGDLVPGPARPGPEDTIAGAFQRLEAGDLDGAIDLAARAGQGAQLRAWLARARAVSAAERALEALGSQVDSAIERRAGEPS